MKKTLVPFVVVPVIVLWLVTVLRAYLEVHSPDGTFTKMLSVLVLSLLWTLFVPAMLLKRGASLLQALLLGLLFFVLHRAAVGVVYAIAWADKWTVAGTSDPVRYVAQTQDQTPEWGPTAVFLGATLAPVLPGLVLLFLVWTITWAFGFRGRRPFAAAVPSAEPVG